MPGWSRIEATGRWLLKKATGRGQRPELRAVQPHPGASWPGVRLPLGGLHKTEVREIAEKRHFINARKHDSQDICFVRRPAITPSSWRTSRESIILPAISSMKKTGQPGGHPSGSCPVHHRPAQGAGPCDGGTGSNRSAAPRICRPTPSQSARQDALVRPRRRCGPGRYWISVPGADGAAAGNRPHPVPSGGAACHQFSPRRAVSWLEFDQPQRAPTPGQAVVLYQGDVVLGGGTITSVER